MVTMMIDDGGSNRGGEEAKASDFLLFIEASRQ